MADGASSTAIAFTFVALVDVIIVTVMRNYLLESASDGQQYYRSGRRVRLKNNEDLKVK